MALMRALRSWPLVLLVVVLLLALNAAILYALAEPEERALTVSFLDVGQGDSILIESPEGVQLLIDAGRDRSVLRELPRIIGPLDRSIDMVLATHPDADHIGGLPDILSRYRVSYFLSSDIESDTDPSKRLDASLEEERGLIALVAKRGMRIHLGEEVHVDVLYPDRDVSKGETNAGSVIVRAVYGETSVLLTGDAPDTVEEYIATLGSVDSDLLKAGHHGSRSSTSAGFLAAVTPELVVISAGKDNSYGHPHEEVVRRIKEAGATMLSTSEEGTITFVSDGVHIRRK